MHYSLTYSNENDDKRFRDTSLQEIDPQRVAKDLISNTDFCYKTLYKDQANKVKKAISALDKSYFGRVEESSVELKVDNYKEIIGKERNIIQKTGRKVWAVGVCFIVYACKKYNSDPIFETEVRIQSLKDGDTFFCRNKKFKLRIVKCEDNKIDYIAIPKSAHASAWKINAKTLVKITERKFN